MKTIVFNIEYKTEKDMLVVMNDERIYSSAFRYSFNRFIDGIEKKEIYHDLSGKFSELGSHIRDSAISDAKGQYEAYLENKKSFYKDDANKDKPYKVHFGKLFRYQNKLITKDEYRESRNRGLMSVGEANQHGNRMFKLDVDKKAITYKRRCKEHIEFGITEKLSEKRRELLKRIEIAMSEMSSPITMRIKRKKLYITYDESEIEKYKRFHNLRSNRILGIDSNPNYIGLSIIDCNDAFNFDVVHKRVYDIKELLKLDDSNKENYELSIIGCEIVKLCKHFRVGKMAVEKLDFDVPLTKRKNSVNKNGKRRRINGRDQNRLLLNKWKYRRIFGHLKTLCNTYGIEFAEVNAAYSSQCGNLIYGSENTPDMVAASMEIARRSFKQFEKGTFYPPFNKERVVDVLGSQWKDEPMPNFNSWKGLFPIIKESKPRYRFPLDESAAVFRHNYSKRLTVVNVFNGS